MGPGQVGGGTGGLVPVQEEGVRGVVVEGEDAEAVDVGSAEGGRLANRRGARVGVGDLEADGEVTG